MLVDSPILEPSPSLSTFSFICGDDDYLVDCEGKKFFDSLSGHLSDFFSKEIINAKVQTVTDIGFIVQEFIKSAQTRPFLGERKVIWLRGVNFLADTVLGRAEGTKTQLERLQEMLGQLDYSLVNVLVTASPVDKRTRAYKHLSTSSNFQVVASESKFILNQLCQSLDIGITPKAQEILMAKVNGNARLLTEEVNKLATYLGGEGKTIDVSLVMDLVPEFGESDFFEISEAFFSRDLKWTLNAIKRFFFNQKESRPLITSLQNRLRLLIQLRVLIDSGSFDNIDKITLQSVADAYSLDPQLKSSLNIASQNPWYLNKLAVTARKISLRSLIDCQQAILEAFETILQFPQDQEAVIRNLVFKCLG